MSYVKTPWVALKNDDILDAISEALAKVNMVDDLKAAYTHLSNKPNVAEMIRDHLLKGTEIGKIHFYDLINKNWDSLPDGLYAELKEISVLSDAPPEYLLNYGCKYETVFANAPTGPLDHLDFTLICSLWRDTSLSNLHFTFT